MKIGINTKHNTHCIFEDWEPGKSDPLQHAAETFPNAFRALDLLKEFVEGKGKDIKHVEKLVVTVFLDHCGGMFTDRPQRLAKTKSGYSAAIVMTQADLRDGQDERSINDISAALKGKMEEILQRPALAPS